MECNFSDNVVDYFKNCLADVEKLEMDNNMFDKVNQIFVKHFTFGQNNTYYDGCPHIDKFKNYAIFCSHWCYNKEKIGKCNECNFNYSEWVYGCCLDENCIYGIIMKIFCPLLSLGLYIRQKESEPEPREWIVGNINDNFHDIGGILELQLDIYYRDKVPELIQKLD